jgi:hypothetical protein
MTEFMETDELDFNLDIVNRTTFSQAIEIVSHTLATATISIEKDDQEDSAVIMRIDAMDNSQCCAVKMRFKCQGSVVTDGIVVSVKLKTLLALLKTTPNSETINIRRQTGADVVHLRCLPNMGSETHEYALKTLDVQYDPVPINDIESHLTVEFDTQKLKSYIRVAKEIKSDVIRLRVFERDDQNIVFCLSCDGDDSDAKWQYHFTNQVSENGNFQFCVAPENATTHATGLAPAYDACFDCKFIDQFVRAMDRSSVVMAMSNDNAGNSQPLVIEYALGQEEASVRFILAPKVSA